MLGYKIIYNRFVYLFALSLYLFSPLANAEDYALPKDKCYLVVASRASLPAVAQYINENNFFNYQVFISQNGWYAITLEGIAKDKIPYYKKEIYIPDDSFCSNGRKFIKKIDNYTIEKLRQALLADSGQASTASPALEAPTGIEPKVDKNLTLIEAARDNEYFTVRYLIEHGADVNLQSLTGHTALMSAVFNGYKDIVDYLITHGANIHLKNKDDWDALMFALYKNHPEIVVYLLENGADANTKIVGGTTAFMFAARYGNVTLMNLLHSKGADIFAADDLKNAALHIAIAQDALNKQTEVAWLIENGADVNAKGSGGFTPLMLAAEFGHKEIITLLIENGADVNTKNQAGFTALYYAALPYYKSAEEIKKIVALLKENGAG